MPVGSMTRSRARAAARGLMRRNGSGAGAAGDIAFNATVNTDAGAAANRALTVNTAGRTLFGDGGADNVGVIRALASLTTDAGGTTVFNIAGGAQSVLTSGTQTYNDAVALLNGKSFVSAALLAMTFRQYHHDGPAPPAKLPVTLRDWSSVSASGFRFVEPAGTSPLQYAKW